MILWEGNYFANIGAVGQKYTKSGINKYKYTSVILREGNYFANKHISVQLNKNTQDNKYTSNYYYQG